jgi:hypothetical protein
MFCQHGTVKKDGQTIDVKDNVAHTNTSWKTEKKDIQILKLDWERSKQDWIKLKQTLVVALVGLCSGALLSLLVLL